MGIRERGTDLKARFDELISGYEDEIARLHRLLDAAEQREEKYTLREAARILNGPRPLSGMVTPENPFGQCTVTLPDGRKANGVTGEIAPRSTP